MMGNSEFPVSTTLESMQPEAISVSHAAWVSDGLVSQRTALSHERCLAHVLARIAQAEIGKTPFHHIFIEEIFPEYLYNKIREYMISCKYSQDTQDRHQDNPKFVNRRFNIFELRNDVVDSIRDLFSTSEIKIALLEKFYAGSVKDLSNKLSIHEEFEFFFTEAGRFQNIHVDIPPKFLSFVFYIPEKEVPQDVETCNATIMYDKSLNPHYMARFKSNSVCIFAPHYYSYHGFSSTIDRDVLVMFYTGHDNLQKWRALRQSSKDLPPFSGLKDAVEDKLREHPLIEYSEEGKLEAERLACLVNSPQGRVMRDRC